MEADFQCKSIWQFLDCEQHGAFDATGVKWVQTVIQDCS
jgi:hypothetical protein